jgi:hypothetical protein
MSVATIASFDPATGMFISAPAGKGRTEKEAKLAAEFHKVSSEADDFLGTGYGSNGKTFSSCRDPSSFETRCLEKGDTCPDS